MAVEINARSYTQGMRDGLLQAAQIADAATDHTAGASSVAFEIRGAMAKVEADSPYTWQLNKRSS